MNNFSNWLILQIDDSKGNPEYHDIEKSIVSLFGDGVDFFIPIHFEKIGSYISTSVLIEGYVFIKDCTHVRQILATARDTRIFNGALYSSTGRMYTLPATTIGVMKRRLKNSLRKDFQPDTKVKILGGILSGLIGEVVDIEDRGLKVNVRIKRHSREILAPIPATLLEKVS